jgi:hypothetical protein
MTKQKKGQTKRKKTREASDPVADVLTEYVAKHPHLQSAMERRNREPAGGMDVAQRALSAFRGDG